MSDSENEKQVKRIASLGQALGMAWGRVGFIGPPRFVIVVGDEHGDWRIASTEEMDESLTILRKIIEHPPEATHEALARYKDKKEIS